MPSLPDHAPSLSECIRDEATMREEDERHYRGWCSEHGYDPEDVGAAVEYEEWYRECVLPEEPQPGYIN